MNIDLIVRAWKDPEFRARLSAEQRASLPESPSGKPMTELGEGELSEIIGGVKEPPIGPTTGCTDVVTPSCGIRLCPVTETF